MAEGAKNSGALVWGGVVLAGGYFLYKKVLQPNVITPIQTKHYVMRLMVNIIAVRFKGDNVEFDLYVQNPNSQPMKVGAIVGNVFVTDQAGRATKLGNVYHYQQIVLKAQGETKVTMSIRLKFLGMLKYFQDMIAGKITNQSFSFVGNININGRLYPVKESYRIS